MPGEIPVQRASDAENVSSWWRHHGSTRMWLYRNEHGMIQFLKTFQTTSRIHNFALISLSCAHNVRSVDLLMLCMLVLFAVHSWCVWFSHAHSYVVVPKYCSFVNLRIWANLPVTKCQHNTTQKYQWCAPLGCTLYVTKSQHNTIDASYNHIHSCYSAL